MTACLDVDPAVAAVAVAFWQAVTMSTVASSRGARDEISTLVPPDGDPHLRLQDAPVGSAPCHVNVHVQDVDGAAERAVASGADVITAADNDAEDPLLMSPGGFVFTLVRLRGESQRPAPVRWPGGHRSIVDQLCLDIPAPAFEREGRFWAALTGWEWYQSRPSFSLLGRPAGQPLRLLFQRLEDAAAGEPVTAHLDLACDQPTLEAERHVALGAHMVRRMPYWITLADPCGRHYCLTARNPDTGVIEH
jgi:hypothetical protein